MNTRSLRYLLCLCAVLLLPITGWSQAIPSTLPPRPLAATSAAPATPRPPVVPSYFDPAAIHPELIIGLPPQPGTKAQEADLAAVHKLYDNADAKEIVFAQQDARSQNIFLFSTIFGPGYNAQNLPYVATLGQRLVRDAGIENGLLKARFQHPRPYRLDPKLASRCGVDNTFSYPSGHSMAAYLLAYAVSQMVPEKAKEIMARADQFAEHRVVCAVHFPTDIAAGKLVSLEMYGYMLSTSAYQQDVNAATAELRTFLNLPVTLPGR